MTMKLKLFLLFMLAFSFLVLPSVYAQNAEKTYATQFSFDDNQMTFFGESFVLNIVRDCTNFIYIHAKDPEKGFVFETRKKDVFQKNKVLYFCGEKSGEIYETIRKFLEERGIVFEEDETGHVGFY